MLLLCISIREESGETEIKIRTISATIWKKKYGVRVGIICGLHLAVFIVLTVFEGRGMNAESGHINLQLADPSNEDLGLL